MTESQVACARRNYANSILLQILEQPEIKFMKTCQTYIKQCKRHRNKNHQIGTGAIKHQHLEALATLSAAIKRGQDRLEIAQAQEDIGTDINGDGSNGDSGDGINHGNDEDGGDDDDDDDDDNGNLEY
ncbi:hypothetical protein EDD11_008602 [Mortierella claussenii]|nr:hypothetical protein EDD11_008602 [Mortierella claussenii]